jgi:hypothetical protein
LVLARPRIYARRRASDRSLIWIGIQLIQRRYRLFVLEKPICNVGFLFFTI